MLSQMTLKDVIESIGPQASDRPALPRLRLIHPRSTVCRNPNHPKKGDRIKVEPIRQVEDIKAIRDLLSGRPRDLLLFTLGINTNLRASDIVALTIGQVRHLRPMDDLELREKKTSKMRRISLNKSVTDAVAAFVSTLTVGAPDSAPLFPSQRGKGALTVSSVHRMVKGWCRAVNLRGNYGSHTLRKTWGYHQRATFKVDIPSLMVCFNHSNQRQTLDYLCVQPEEVRQVYSHEL